MLDRKIVYVDMDNVLVDFEEALTSWLKIRPIDEEVFAGSYDEIPGLFSLMLPMDGAIDAYHTLSEKYDVYILSTAPWDNPSAWRDKLEWVKKHLGDVAHKRLILSHHKNLLMGDYLIDDRTKNGAGEFTGEHIHFGTPQFPNWNFVLDYLVHLV